MKSQYVPLINGIEWSYANVQLSVGSTIIRGVTEISYSTEAEVENLYGAGSGVIARGYGNKTFSASITIYSKEIMALQDAAREQGIEDGDITSLLPFDVFVTYIPEQGQGLARVDTLYDCSFMNNERSMADGDTSITVSLDLLPARIELGATS